MKTKLYHTSGTKFKPGDVFGGPGLTVCMTTNPIPHGTIQSIVVGGFSCYQDYLKEYLKIQEEYWIVRDKWNDMQIGEKPICPKVINPKPVKLWVYEVKPFEKPIWININEEYRAIDTFVEVVSIVGNAKGILDNHYRKFGDKTNYFGGNAVRTVKNT